MARRKPRVVGAQALGKNMRKLKGITQSDVARGLIVGGELVMKDSQQGTPRRTGNLITSAYTVSQTEVRDDGGGFEDDSTGKLATNHGQVVSEGKVAVTNMSKAGKQAVAVGHTAFYALMVHENPRAGAAGYDPAKDKEGLTSDQVHSRVGGWKFLESALKGARQKVLQSITAAARLPNGKVIA